jgi:transcriptional regulator with XRE-family HTH domain
MAKLRREASETRKKLEHQPGPSELLTAQEREDAAPFYFELREYIRQLKAIREAAKLTLADVATRSGLAVESLSRLETGAQTNPTWKTLGLYAKALGCRPLLCTTAAAAKQTPPRTADRRSPDPLQTAVNTTVDIKV